MAERGHSLDSIKKSIESRKPDFDAYIDPQKKDADVIIQVRRKCPHDCEKSLSDLELFDCRCSPRNWFLITRESTSVSA
jgi:uridine kinase